MHTSGGSPGTTPRSPAPGSRLRELGPGLLLVACLAGTALVLAPLVAVPGLVAALLLGVAAAQSGWAPPKVTPGAAFAARWFLRAGVVLLGFRLSLAQIRDLGFAGAGFILILVALTLAGTYFAGRRLGLTAQFAALVAAGYAICGASAVAAMSGVVDADEEEVAYAVSIVTLAGTLAVITLPVLGGALGLNQVRFGWWAGASVHDVAQVAAAGAAVGPAALEQALIVRLTRVAFLAPIMFGASLIVNRRRVAIEGPKTRRTPLVPSYIVLFLVAVSASSLGWVNPGQADLAARGATILLAIALAGLGTRVRLAAMRRIGWRPALLGLLAWVLVAGASLGGIRLGVWRGWL